MMCSSPPRYAYARMRRSSSTTFPSLKFGLLAVAWTAGRAGPWAKLAETARSENNGTARPIATDPQSARVRVSLRLGITIRLILYVYRQVKRSAEYSARCAARQDGFIEAIAATHAPDCLWLLLPGPPRETVPR